MKKDALKRSKMRSVADDDVDVKGKKQLLLPVLNALLCCHRKSGLTEDETFVLLITLQDKGRKDGATRWVSRAELNAGK